MNRRQALMNALAAVSYKQTDAMNQQRLARDLGNESLDAFWQKEADEAKQTYQELFAILGECHEPQASPADSTDRVGNDGGHHPSHSDTGHQPGRSVQVRDGDDYERQKHRRHSRSSARPAEMAAGAVPGDKTVSGTIAASTGIDATGRDGCLTITGGADHD